MNWTKKCLVSLVALLLTANVIFSAAFADDDEHKEKRRHQEGDHKQNEHQGKRTLKIVSHPAYKENCGACHFVYQPELLPSGSWAKILADPADHFGEAIEIDPESKKIIAEYLKATAADYSSTKLSAKIVKSIGNQTPQRITEIPYIQKKHREISQNVIKRESIGSLSNCSACHTTAEKGIYGDDYVTIPK